MIGLGLAMGARIGLLLSITWVMSLTNPLFALFGQSVSGKDLILILGGLFLIGKSTHEIHSKLEHAEEEAHGVAGTTKYSSFGSILIQIVLIDLVFSLDSVITAVGMVNPAAGMGRGIAKAFVNVSVVRRATGSTIVKITNRLPMTIANLSLKAGKAGDVVAVDAIGIGTARSANTTVSAATASIDSVELNGL